MSARRPSAARSLLAAGCAAALGIGTALAASIPVTAKRLTVSSSSEDARPVALVIADGGMNVGEPRESDTVVVTFSQPMSVSSICSTWSNNNADQSITASGVVTVTIENNTAGGNDRLLVSTTSAACGGSFRFGSINLGSGSFVTATRQYSGNNQNASTIQWSASSRRLTIKLGQSPASNIGTVSTAVTAIYTPDSAMTNTTGTPVTGVATSTGVHF